MEGPSATVDAPSADLPADSPPADSWPPFLSQNHLQIAWIVTNFLFAFLCFCIFVPIAMTESNSNGHCLLYADTGGFGHDSVCSYCIGITVIFMIICVIKVTILILKMSKYSSKLPQKALHNMHIGIGLLIIDLILAFLLFVAACVISAGFSHMCDSLFGGRSECDSPWGLGLLPSGDVNLTYHDQLSVAEVSAWIIVVLWLLVICFKIIILRKNGSLQQYVTKAKNVFVTEK